MQNGRVFQVTDPEMLPMRHHKAWEYFQRGDDVEVTLQGVACGTGVVVDVMADGSAIWVYINGVGRRLFGADENVQVTSIGYGR